MELAEDKPFFKKRKVSHHHYDDGGKDGNSADDDGYVNDSFRPQSVLQFIPLFFARSLFLNLFSQLEQLLVILLFKCFISLYKFFVSLFIFPFSNMFRWHILSHLQFCFLNIKTCLHKLYESFIKNASQRSLESNHSLKEARFGLHLDDKLKDAIIKMYSSGFSFDGIAYQTDLPELHVREVLADEISH